ncbi:hypothetical protein F5887DRAFT_119484 [Amanita rubescens]|nr:hypothetical protein F5887DRAFT_119484 [Amanita rubescens]
MRIISVTLTFLFLSTVLATPIYPVRRDTIASLAKRGGSKHTTSSASTPKAPSTAKSSGQGSASGPKTGGTKGGPRKKQKCRRTTSTELVKALRAINGPEIGAGKFGKSYRLKYAGQDAVVKVVKTKEVGADIVRQEVVHLKQVHQFLAWGRRAAAGDLEGLDYIVMPDMGVPYDKIGLSKSQAEEYMYKARDHYETTYKMKHTDAHLGNALFKKNGNTIECHLVDWLWADNGETHFENPGEPFTIAEADCVFDPWATFSDSEHSSGSEGYMADRSSPPGPHR